MPDNTHWKWRTGHSQVLRRSAVRKHVAFLINRCGLSPNEIKYLLKDITLKTDLEEALEEVKGDRHVTNP